MSAASENGGSGGQRSGEAEPDMRRGLSSRWSRASLSLKLLTLTFFFVMLAEMLILPPSIANFRKNWLRQQLVVGQIASIATYASSGGGLNAETQANLRLETGLLAATRLDPVSAGGVAATPQCQSQEGPLAIRNLPTADTRPRGEGVLPPQGESARAGDIDEPQLVDPAARPIRVFVISAPPDLIVHECHEFAQAKPGLWEWPRLIGDSLKTFMASGDRNIRIIGPISDPPGAYMEIVVGSQRLKEAMAEFAMNILALSLVISVFTAILVYVALNRLFVLPMKRIASNMASFSETPEDRSAVIEPSRRGDEVGVAERALSLMQLRLSDTLREKDRLSTIGLGLSKIAHDLRNMLTTAQLIADRLADSDDPAVKRANPRLLQALAKAIRLCEETAKYGKRSELPPMRASLCVRSALEEALDCIKRPEGDIELLCEVEDGLRMDADPQQIGRVFENLLLNARNVLNSNRAKIASPYIRVRANRYGEAAEIFIEDNGPGIPEHIRKDLFKPFKNSGSASAGLGLAIASEIVTAHGGSLTIETVAQGACFRIAIPYTGAPSLDNETNQPDAAANAGATNIVAAERRGL